MPRQLISKLETKHDGPGESVAAFTDTEETGKQNVRYSPSKTKQLVSQEISANEKDSSGTNE